MAPRHAARAALLAAFAAACVGVVRAERVSSPRQLGAEEWVRNAKSSVGRAARAVRPRRRPVLAVGAAILAALGGAVDPAIRFREMDADGSGAVDKEEFMLASKVSLDEVGMENRNMRKIIYRTAERLYDTCDIDNTGLLNPAEVEFCEFLVFSELYTARTITPAEMEMQRLPEEEQFGGHKTQALMSAFDADGSGHLDFQEYSVGFRDSVVGWGFSMDAMEHPDIWKEIRELYDKADVTGDGVLDLRELQFGAFLANGMAVRQVCLLIRAGMDVDLDGFVSRSEAEDVVAELGDGATGTSIGEIVLSIFDHIDENKDGRLDEQEAERAAAMVLSARTP